MSSRIDAPASDGGYWLSTGTQEMCSNMNSFSLQAAVRCGAGGRQVLEQFRRYINRPALAHKRVQFDTIGQVVLKRKATGTMAPRTW